MPQPDPAHTPGRSSTASPVTLFATRHPRLVSLLVGLLVLVLSTGGSQSVLTDAADKAHEPLGLTFALAPATIAFAVCVGWWRFAPRVEAIAPRSLRLTTTYRRESAFATTNGLAPFSLLSLLGPGLAIGATLSQRSQPLWISVPFLGLFALLLLMWLYTTLLPSRLRLTPTGLVCRWVWRNRVVTWDAVFPGQSPTHHDQDGNIWLLVDWSVADRRIDKMAGRPDGPAGYHWIRASGFTLVDSEALATAIRYYRATPSARSLIGTGSELERLQAHQ